MKNMKITILDEDGNIKTEEAGLTIVGEFEVRNEVRKIPHKTVQIAKNFINDHYPTAEKVDNSRPNAVETYIA